MDTETKVCPMCGETILAVAKKCKYCLEYLEFNNESFKNNELTKIKLGDSKLKIDLSRLEKTHQINNIAQCKSSATKRLKKIHLKKIPLNFFIFI